MERGPHSIARTGLRLDVQLVFALWRIGADPLPLELERRLSVAEGFGQCKDRVVHLLPELDIERIGNHVDVSASGLNERIDLIGQEDRASGRVVRITVLHPERLADTPNLD